jgi:hypothetical protein
VLYPTVLLWNILVLGQEDNARTDGEIPPAAVEEAMAIIRHAYSLPDFDRPSAQGVAISLIGQFFHPDDYREQRVAQVHARTLLHALQGDDEMPPLVFDHLRTDDQPSPARLTQAGSGARSLYYKQRFLSFCFAGRRAELEGLRQDIPGQSLAALLNTIAHAADIGDEARALSHPSFVPVADLQRVSEQNAVQWARLLARLVKEGKVSQLLVSGPPGPSYVVRPRTPPPKEEKSN